MLSGQLNDTKTGPGIIFMSVLTMVLGRPRFLLSGATTVVIVGCVGGGRDGILKSAGV